MIAGFWCTNVLGVMRSLGLHTSTTCLQDNQFGEHQLSAALNSFHDRVWWPVRYLPSPTVVVGTGSKLAAYYHWFCDERTGVHRPDARGTRTFAAHISARDITPCMFKTLMRLRLGCWRLRVNTGRFDGTPREQRTCTFCGLGEVEDEEHVLIRCTHYRDIRSAHAGLFGAREPTVAGIMNHQSQSTVASFVWMIYRRRFPAAADATLLEG